MAYSSPDPTQTYLVLSIRKLLRLFLVRNTPETRPDPNIGRWSEHGRLLDSLLEADPQRAGDLLFGVIVHDLRECGCGGWCGVGVNDNISIDVCHSDVIP